jgi:hypothetical protein
MNLFPTHHGGDCWSCTHKELFFLFVRILLQHLKVTKADELRREVKETIAQCRAHFLQAPEGRIASSSSSVPVAKTTATTTTVAALPACHQACGITVALYDQLRLVVPEETWREAELYLRQYLRARQEKRTTTNHHCPNQAQQRQRLLIARQASPPPPSS